MSARVGEAGAVITDLGEQPRADEVAHARQAAVDRCIGVGVEGVHGGLLQVAGRVAGDAQLSDQSLRLVSHRLLDQGWLVQVLAAQDLVQLTGAVLEVAHPAATTQRSDDLGLGHARGGSRTWGGGEQAHSIDVMQSGRGPAR